MEIYEKREAMDNQLQLVQDLRDTVFIHPTDTVYGIGCDATNRKLVQRLRETKRQHERPLSVIAPGIDWIQQYCEVPAEAREWLAKLPGPYTLILPLNDDGKREIADLTNLCGDTIGVRQPDHWFTSLVKHMQTPTITTSANISGRDYIKELEELDEELEDAVDIAINDGRIEGTPSTIIDFTGEEPEIIRD